MADLRNNETYPGPQLPLLAIYDILQMVAFGFSLPLLLYRVFTRERYRVGLSQRLSVSLPSPPGERKRIWIHAASAGEMVAVSALVPVLEKRHPDCDVILSSTTSAGIEVAQRRLPDREVFVLPLDVGPIAGRVFRRVRPIMLILVELELWPNLIARAISGGVPVVVANGRISKKTARRYRHQWLRRFVGLAGVSAIAAQNEEIRNLLIGVGVAEERVRVTGNMKIDVEVPSTDDRQTVRANLGFAEGDMVLVAGSTHPGEEALLGRLIHDLNRDRTRALKLVVAPRHLERLAEAERNLQDVSLAPTRLSSFREGRGRPADSQEADTGPVDTILVDTMGELASLYQGADLAFVGGSLVPGTGGHNVFEPVQAGVFTLVGPYHGNVRSDVLFLEKVGALGVVESPESLQAAVLEFLQENSVQGRKEVSEFLLSARGAADRTTDWIEERCLAGEVRAAELKDDIEVS